MLKKVLLYSTILYCTSLFSQTTNAFRVNYDQAFLDLPANAIEALTPSNYVFAGTNANIVPLYGTVTQVDDLGALVWSKRYYDGSFGFQINDIKKDPTLNEYYVCGGSESNAAVFMRIDASGNIIVSKRFSITQADGAYLNRVIKTSDGGYVAVGYVTGHDPDGAGPEIKFSTINYTNDDGAASEVIGSPLIVKFDANGDHVWHHVFRYYTAATKLTTQRIYNDASLNDVVEVADGYIAVGQYDVNQHLSRTNADGDDSTPNDAIILKTTTAGAITYHHQIDAPNTSSTQSSKYLAAISKTSVGDPIAAGSTDDGYELIMKYQALGNFGLTFSQRYRYSSGLFGTNPADISQIYEVDGGTDIVTMGMYVQLTFGFPTLANSIHRVNSTATTNTWAKYYTFGLATILPRGAKTSDGGYIMNSTVMNGANFDYHLIKTDPTGETPLTGCAATAFTPAPSAGPSTIADPYANNWSGTVGPQALAVTVSNITPTATVQCSYTSCTPPPAPVIGTITQPTCSVATGSVDLSGLPSSGSWTVTASPGGATITGSGTTATFSGLAAGTYTFTVTDNASCTSVASANAVINAQPTTPSAPIIGTITQPTCSVATGSVDLSGLPGSGSWTVTVSPGGATVNGSGTTTSITGLTANTTYTFTVTNADGCTSSASTNAAINVQPTTPSAPIVGTITQPNCTTPTGSVALSGLPATGSWTVTASPGGATTTGTGTTGTFSGLTGGDTYTFTVTNSGGCTSSASTNAAINAAPAAPAAPVIGTITQPTCSVSTGSVDLSGLPASGNWTVTASPGGATINGTGTTASFTGLTAGTTYTFTVTNDAGCTSSASTNADINSVPGAPTAPIIGTITQPTCSVATASVDLSGLPASGNWTITVSPGGATINGSGTTTTISPLAAGTTYTFTVTNDLGCTSPSSANAVINTQPTTPTTPIVGTITQPTCSVATGSVDFSGLPASGNWTITASPGGATYNGTGTTGTFTGLTAGTTYTFTVTNSDGCTSSATTNAAINNQPVTPTAPIIGSITQPTCSVSTGSVDLSGLPTSSNWTVTATPGGATINGTGTTGTFSGLSQGTSYTFTVTNSDGCTSSTSTNADIDPVAGAPVITLDDITHVTCNGGNNGEILISVTGGQGPYNYQWTPNQGNTSNPTGLSAGSYTVLVTDDLGCTATETYVIDQPNPIVIDANVTDVVCESSLGSITTNVSGGTGPYTYLWIPNGEITPNIIDLAGGNYGVTVTDSEGCTANENYTVNIIGSLSINVTPDYTLIEEGESVTLTASGGTSYSWTPSTDLSCDDCEITIASPSETTTYYVTSIDSSGCTGADTALVEIQINCGDLYVPNIFSPNGDMNNDYLCIYGSCVRKLSYAVYDRWGEKVFETEFTVDLEAKNYEEVCWDGTYKGKPLNTGVFAYKIYAELDNGDIIEESGNITLVK